MLQHREPGNPTAGWAQAVIFHDAIKCTTTGHWSASDLVEKREKKVKLKHCHPGSGRGGADKASSGKVNINEGEDEDAFEIWRCDGTL